MARNGVPAAVCDVRAQQQAWDAPSLADLSTIASRATLTPHTTQPYATHSPLCKHWALLSRRVDAIKYLHTDPCRRRPLLLRGAEDRVPAAKRLTTMRTTAWVMNQRATFVLGRGHAGDSYDRLREPHAQSALKLV